MDVGWAGRGGRVGLEHGIVEGDLAYLAAAVGTAIDALDSGIYSSKVGFDLVGIERTRLGRIGLRLAIHSTDGSSTIVDGTIIIRVVDNTVRSVVDGTIIIRRGRVENCQVDTLDRPRAHLRLVELAARIVWHAWFVDRDHLVEVGCHQRVERSIRGRDLILVWELTDRIWLRLGLLLPGLIVDHGGPGYALGSVGFATVPATCPCQPAESHDPGQDARQPLEHAGEQTSEPFAEKATR